LGQRVTVTLEMYEPGEPREEAEKVLPECVERWIVRFTPVTPA
jgi:hypothetical protein